MLVARRVIIFSMASHHGLSSQKKKMSTIQPAKICVISIPDTPPCPDTIIAEIQGLRSDGIRPHHHAALVVFSTILSACHGDKSCPFLDFTRVGQWTSPANASPETNNAETQKSKGIDDFLLVDVWIELSQLQGFTKTAN